METKKWFFLILFLCMFGTEQKAQSLFPKTIVETQNSRHNSGYDCLGVWAIISPTRNQVKNGILECNIEFPPEAVGKAIPPAIYGPSILKVILSTNHIELHLDANELTIESKITGGLVVYELVVPKWVDKWGRPSTPDEGIICHYHIEIRLNNLY